MRCAKLSGADMPKNWPYGLFAIGAMAPNYLPKTEADARGWGGATLSYTMNYALNPALASWALTTSKRQVTLLDVPGLKAFRSQYTAYPAAQQPPQILLGGTLATARYWHGEARTQWARDWVKLWTGGQDKFVTTSMEQAVYVGTLQRMAKQGYVDFQRVMMLRGASNYSMPPTGQSVMATIGDTSLGTAPAFEAQYRAGSAVAHALLKDWDRYATGTPTP